MAAYLDTSALVKLVVREAETQALFDWMRSDERVLVSSDLARTELMRAVRRVAPGLAPRARTVLDSISLLALHTTAFEEAGRIGPPTLRSLDALHLAAALSLGDDLTAFVAYDERLAEAARELGLPVVAPA